MYKKGFLKSEVVLTACRQKWGVVVEVFELNCHQLIGVFFVDFMRSEGVPATNLRKQGERGKELRKIRCGILPHLYVFLFFFFKSVSIALYLWKMPNTWTGH